MLREKDLGTYAIVIAQFQGSTPPAVSESDACLKMSFPLRDIQSLRAMLTLLQEDFQGELTETNASVMIQDDLPGGCDEVVEQIAKRFPQAAEQARARCEALKERQEGEQQGGGETYDSTGAQCTVAPDKTCSPGMSSEQYPKYGMSFVTPSDGTVVAEAKKYADVGAMYLAAQKRYWQSDTSLFGCSDKFQKPSYYLATSPTIDSSMACAAAVGDCDDKAVSFASLLIASGFFEPSEVRVAMGTVQFGKRPTDIGGHAWTEVYVGDHWIPVDATFGNVCQDNGTCTTYKDSDFVDWDYFNYVEYPVIEYWGWSNDTMYYISSTKETSANLPAYWKEEAKTIYEVAK